MTDECLHRDKVTDFVTCLLHSLFACQRFQDAVLGTTVGKSQQILHALSRVFQNMRKSKPCEPDIQRFIKTYKEVYGKDIIHQDHIKFTRGLLDTLTKENQSLTDGILTGQKNAKYTCPNCDRKVQDKTLDPTFTNLSVPITESQGLHRVLLSEMLQEKQWQLTKDKTCRHCDYLLLNHPEAVEFQKVPDVLTLVLRHHHRQTSAGKLDIELQEQLDLEAVLPLSKEHSGKRMIYFMKAIIFGNSKEYSCLTKNQNQPLSWTYFKGVNYPKETLESFDQVVRGTAGVPIIIIYVKAGTEPVEIRDCVADPEIPKQVAKEIILTGLKSERHTSYLNSVVQALFSCTRFRNEVLNFDPERSSEQSPSMRTALQKVFKKLQTSNGTPFYPDELIALQLKVQHGDAYQDSSDYYRDLMHQLTKDRSRFCDESLFCGKLERNKTCPECRKSSPLPDDNFKDLILTLPKGHGEESITSLLQNYFTSFELEGNPHQCHFCGRLRNFEINVKAKKLPQYLVLSIGRFYYDNPRTTLETKNMTKVFCNPKLDQTAFCMDGQGSLEYSLTAVIVHYGKFASGGTYSCYAQITNLYSEDTVRPESQKDTWHYFKDDVVTSVTDPTFDKYSETPVLLVYQKINRQSNNRTVGLHAKSTYLESSTLTERADHMTGLRNLGNTCYMNSVVQALFMCQRFRQDILQCRPNQENRITLELQKVFQKLNVPNGVSFSPRAFLEESQPQWFRHGSQQDSSEYLRYLIDQLSEEGTKSAEQLFTGKLVRNVTCASCKTPNKGSMESFTDLMLHIKDMQTPLNISHLLKYYFRPCPLQGDDMYHCPKCNAFTHAELTLQVHELPEFLILTILRFEASDSQYSSSRGKKMTAVDCDPDILLDMYLDEGKPNQVRYMLNAVIVHCGYFASMGHYMCYARNSIRSRHQNGSYSHKSAEESSWYCFDDSVVRQVEHVTFNGYGMTPVILIYEKFAKPEDNRAMDNKNILQQSEKPLPNRNFQSKGQSLTFSSEPEPVQKVITKTVCMLRRNRKHVLTPIRSDTSDNQHVTYTETKTLSSASSKGQKSTSMDGMTSTHPKGINIPPVLPNINRHSRSK